MSSSKFIGTGVAMVTPFKGDGSIDFDALTTLTNHLIEGGVDYLVVMGTTAESATLSKDEKKAVINHIKSVNQGRLPIVVGMGNNDTQALVKQIKDFDFDGIDAILSVTPAYNKPNQRGIYEHYKAVATASPVSIILYNVPSRTSSNMSAETTLKLANDFKNIVAIKEATDDMSQIGYIAKNCSDDFLLISGNDNLSLQLIALGASGTISVVGNAFPREFSRMIQLSLKNDFNVARALQFDMMETVDALFEDGSPAGIKVVLSLMGIIENNLRLPLVPASEVTYNKLKNLVTERISTYATV